MTSTTGRHLLSCVPDRGSRVHFCAVSLIILAAVSVPSVQAASLDTLLFIDIDGQPEHVQHTIGSDGELIVVELPADARLPYAHFMGPEHQTFAHAWDEDTTRLALWSGSALLRYSLRDEQESPIPQNEGPASSSTELALSGYLPTLDIEDGELSHWRITLVLPSSLRPVDWAPIDDSGTWTLSGGQILSWQQPHARRLPLNVSMVELTNRLTEDEDPCEAAEATSDGCATDSDADNVPDHRDLCLEPAAVTASGTATRSAANSVSASAAGSAAGSAATAREADAIETRKQDEFGCPPTRPLRLDGIAFQAGQSYLDIGSRRILDRLAVALMHFEERRYQIGAHTDSEGTDSYNRSLSKMRAESVRRYLMLRGIMPERLQAAGYGEDYPRRGNDSIAGRRANRRVELKRLD